MNKMRLALASWAVLTLIFIVGDYFFHVRTGVLHYGWEPIVGGQSAWVWLVFAAASAAMIAITLPFPVHAATSSNPWPAMVRDAAILVVVYALTGAFGESHPMALLAALVIAWLVRVLMQRADRSVYLVHGVVLATLGVVGEGLFSKAGLFAFDLQQVLGCPWWLAGFYLHGSVALLQVARGWKSLGRA